MYINHLKTKKVFYFLPIISISILLSACTTTKISSFRDSSVGSKQYKKILVLANLDDIQWQEYVETRFANELSNKGIIAVRSLDIFPPTREYNEKEVKKRMIANKIESSLFIKVSKSAERSYSQGQGHNTVYWNYWGGGSYYTPGQISVNMPWAYFSVDMYDFSNGNKIWYADARTQGISKYAKLRAVVNGFCKKTVKRLGTDALILTK